MLSSVFLVGGGSAEIHKLPYGGIADRFDDFVAIESLYACHALEAQVSAIKAYEPCECAERLWEHVNESRFVDVAAALVPSASVMRGSFIPLWMTTFVPVGQL